MSRRLLLVVVALLLCVAFFVPGAEAESLMDKIPRHDPAQSSDNPLVLTDTLGTTIVTVVRLCFAAVAVVFVVWIGFIFWGAGGDPERMAQAKKMIVGLLVSLFMIFSAETIVSFLLEVFRL